MADRTIDTRCCIVGGGPAGIMLGFLLARAGVDTVVLEKHADFLRDFRGDTIHPSTLELMHELGLLAAFLKLPHQEAHTLSARVGNFEATVADFGHLPTQCRFVAFMPQWDFLDFLADRARGYPNFHLEMRAEASDLIIKAGAVVGVRANTPQGVLEIRAPLTVGCDGRHSVVRSRAGFKVENLGAPMDVLWFRFSRKPQDSAETVLAILPGRIFITINRGEYWQCAYVIPKGAAEDLRRRDIAEFRERIASSVPAFRDRMQELANWDTVKVLTVAVDRLPQWYRPGLLCIGDAAHAMSPIGGVGINLAIQDAVAAANILAGPLGANELSEDLLQAVQRRREFPARLTQRAQVFIQNNVIAGVLKSTGPIKPPLILKLLQRWKFLRRVPARLIGMGVRPEHIKPALPAAGS